MTNAAGGAPKKSNGNGSHGAAPYIDKLSKHAHDAIDVATDKAGIAAEWLDERQQTLKQSREKLVGNYSSYITDQPLKALGVAFAAGLVVSFLFGSKRR